MYTLRSLLLLVGLTASFSAWTAADAAGPPARPRVIKGKIKLNGILDLSGSDVTVIGDVEVFAGGELRMGDGRLRVLGDVLLTDDATLILDRGATLELVGHDLALRDGAVLEAASASVTLRGGDVVLEGSSTASLVAATLSIVGGDVLLSDDASLWLRATDLAITPGSEIARAAELCDATTAVRAGEFGPRASCIEVESNCRACTP